MANQSSQVVTDLDATPVVKTNALEIGGTKRVATALLAMTTGAAADIKRFVRIPSRALVLSVAFVNDDLDSNGAPTLAADVGLYRTTGDGGAVVDADFFASAVATLQAATTVFTDVTYESVVIAIANRAKPLWEQLSLASDPGVFYDIAFTYTAGAATHANGNVVMRVEYVLPE